MPKKPTNRGERLTIRFTREELLSVTLEAGKAGQNPTEFAREAVLAAKAPPGSLEDEPVPRLFHIPRQ